MTSDLATLQTIINHARRLVFFGGAGVSKESGIPDFRSQDGLYHQKYDVPPETILSHSYFVRHTEAFYRFYRDKMICLSAKPNAAHLKLAEMEQKGILSAVVTQNIDGLHQMAGSKTVYELHGSGERLPSAKSIPHRSRRDSVRSSCGGHCRAIHKPFYCQPFSATRILSGTPRHFIAFIGTR